MGSIRFFISAAEHSGDSLGQTLIESLRRKFPNAQFVGVGGPKMAAAGCRLLADPTRNAAMLLGALRQVGYWVRLLKEIRQEFVNNPPDVVIPIDSPTVNVHIGLMARNMKLPVCYYVAPQHWAWAPWRTRKLSRAVNTLCCVLPFEEPYFRQQRINAVYVGHPLFDRLGDQPMAAAPTSPLPQGKLKVAILPGSRSSEVASNLPVMLEVASQLRGRVQECVFVAAAADKNRALQIQAHLMRSSERIEVRTHVTDAVIAWADLVLVCSGTATLQVASHYKPMIVLYALSRWKWNLAGRFLVRTKYMSLVNILADRELVPEFMPFYGSTRPVVQRAVELLKNPQQRMEMSSQLSQLVSPMERFSRQMPAGDRVAVEVARLLEPKLQPPSQPVPPSRG
ncbi:MAG: lipid-A-disaccharide synthase [Phycisphaerae bacterium]